MKPIDRFFIVLFVCVMCLGVISIAEEITLTTYYPAPYGVYEELTTTGNTYLATDSGNVGIGTVNPQLDLDINGRNDATVATLIIRRGSRNSFLALQGPGGSPYTSKIYVTEFSTGAWLTAISISNQTGGGTTFGDVGIGTTYPTAKLHVNGNIKAVLGDIDGASPANMRYNSGTNEIGYDVAEIFATTEEVEPGDLLVIDEREVLKLRKSIAPYEKGIVGIASGSPAILFEGRELNIAPAPGGFTKGTRPPVALAGRIKCKVSLENGPIEKGDLLTSSSTPGYAMKATDRDKSFGAIVGKALESFDGGHDAYETGEILILITLQ